MNIVDKEHEKILKYVDLHLECLELQKIRPYLFDLMLRGPDRLHFSSNEIILKITCADHVYNTSSAPS